jgi:hypothetical protein
MRSRQVRLYDEVEPRAGANGVAGCFSTANIKTVKMRMAVINISMKTP